MGDDRCDVESKREWKSRVTKFDSRGSREKAVAVNQNRHGHFADLIETFHGGNGYVESF